MGRFLMTGEAELAAVRCSYLPLRAEGFDILVPHLNEQFVSHITFTSVEGLHKA